MAYTVNNNYLHTYLLTYLLTYLITYLLTYLLTYYISSKCYFTLCNFSRGTLSTNFLKLLVYLLIRISFLTGQFSDRSISAFSLSLSCFTSSRSYNIWSVVCSKHLLVRCNEGLKLAYQQQSLFKQHTCFVEGDKRLEYRTCLTIT